MDILLFIYFIRFNFEREWNNMGCKWNNIKEKKVLKDVNISCIYVKFGCEIYVVVK